MSKILASPWVPRDPRAPPHCSATAALCSDPPDSRGHSQDCGVFTSSSARQDPEGSGGQPQRQGRAWLEASWSKSCFFLPPRLAKGPALPPPPRTGRRMYPPLSGASPAPTAGTAAAKGGEGWGSPGGDRKSSSFPLIFWIPLLLPSTLLILVRLPWREGTWACVLHFPGSNTIPSPQRKHHWPTGYPVRGPGAKQETHRDRKPVVGWALSKGGCEGWGPGRW